ncbi:RNA-directed DNA polymerase, eukaryota, reverse transcriptase zinc-binding domain protein [Tanacetum coccineum]
MAKVIGCEAAKFLLKYLGVPVECNMAKCFLCRSSDLWVRVIKNIYGLNGGIMEDSSYSSSQSTWGAILSSVKHIKHKGISLVSLCVCKIGNGVSSRFWEDTWSGNQPIKLQFPRICLLNNVKDCSIADRLSSQDCCSTLRRHPRGGNSARFSVAYIRSLVDSNTLDSASTGTRWNRSIPIKVNVFNWRLMLNKLPTMVNLDRKCIDVGTTLCPICEDDVETVNHIFLSCDMAKDLWALLARWRELDIPICANISKWFAWLDSLHVTNKVRLILEGVGGTLLWSIWSFRNRSIFYSPPPKKAMLWDSIVSQLPCECSQRQAPGTSPRGFGSSSNENNSVRPEELHPKENNMLSVVEPISSTAEEDTPYASILSSQTKTNWGTVLASLNFKISAPCRMQFSKITVSLRYADLLSILPTAEMIIAANGGSNGLHAYVHSLDDAVTDVGFHVSALATQLVEPSFSSSEFHIMFTDLLLGTDNLDLQVALDQKIEKSIAAVVTTSLAVGGQTSHPIFLILALVLSLLLPEFQFNAANNKGTPVSHDPGALIAKYSDPLVFTGSIRVRTSHEILRITSFLQRNTQKLKVPFFVLRGTADTVTDPDAFLSYIKSRHQKANPSKFFRAICMTCCLNQNKNISKSNVFYWTHEVNLGTLYKQVVDFILIRCGILEHLQLLLACVTKTGL